MCTRMRGLYEVTRERQRDHHDQLATTVRAWRVRTSFWNAGHTR